MNDAKQRAAVIEHSVQITQEDFAVDETIHSDQGYEGTRDGSTQWRAEGSVPDRLDFLRDVRGYSLVDTEQHRGVDVPFIDAEGRIWAVVLAEPTGGQDTRDGIWTARELFNERIGHRVTRPNRRGDFQSFHHGFSFGNGRTEPMNFSNSPNVDRALREFYANDHVQEMFSYAENAMQTWFPAHHADYLSAISACQALHPGLQTPIHGSLFPASTFNVGPRVNCLSHRDSGDEASGICLDYMDGNHDLGTGGLLVFHEARRIVRVRKGGVALFPSAIITHETTPVQPHETRFSITGYLSGGIRRYLDAGGRTLMEWERVDPNAVAANSLGGTSRWLSGCQRFKTLEELIVFWNSYDSV